MLRRKHDTRRMTLYLLKCHLSAPLLSRSSYQLNWFGWKIFCTSLCKMHLVNVHFIRHTQVKFTMTLKGNWVLNLFDVYYYSTVLKGSRLSNIAFFSPQQMLTPALLNESLISNYTMKNCIVRF